MHCCVIMELYNKFGHGNKNEIHLKKNERKLIYN